MRMKIVFNPVSDVGNQYPHMFVSFFKTNDIETYSLKQFLNGFKLFRKVKIVHFNWFENILGKTNSKIALDFFARVFVLVLLKLSGKTIVWTMHNKISHDSNGAYFKSKLTAFIIKISDSIIIHSNESRNFILGVDPKADKKIAYINHPNYIGVYGPRLDRAKPASEKLGLLFLGAVKAYKNIEFLIDLAKTFPNDIELRIVGKPSSEQYKRSLLKKVEGLNNVDLELTFINDTEIPGYLANCDLLICPYDMRSSLNSGSVILAFSYGRSVICPEIGTILDLHNINDVFHYNYLTPEEHYRQLELQINRAVTLKKQDPLIFEQMGEKLYNEVKGTSSMEIVGKQFIKLYKSLI